MYSYCEIRRGKEENCSAGMHLVEPHENPHYSAPRDLLNIPARSLPIDSWTMPAIPRFLLPRPFLHSSAPRIFTRKPVCQARNAGTKAQKQKKRAPEKNIKITSPLPQRGKHFSLIESLGNSDSPAITLYTCRNRRFLLSCYGLSSGMLAWSCYTYRTNIADQRPGLPAWVTKVSWGSITVMTGMAVAVAYYPTR